MHKYSISFKYFIFKIVLSSESTAQSVPKKKSQLIIQYWLEFRGLKLLSGIVFDLIVASRYNYFCPVKT